MHSSTEQLLWYVCCRCVSQWSVSAGPLRELMGIFSPSWRHYTAAGVREEHFKAENTSPISTAHLKVTFSQGLNGENNSSLDTAVIKKGCLLSPLPCHPSIHLSVSPSHSLPKDPDAVCLVRADPVLHGRCWKKHSQWSDTYTVCVFVKERVFTGFLKTAAEFRIRWALFVLYVNASAHPSACQSELKRVFASRCAGEQI